MGKALKFREEGGSPGKYEGESAAVEVVHCLSMDGVGQEVGETDTTGWYGFMEGPFLMDALQDDECIEILEERADEGDLEELASAVGCILFEDSNGFVSGTFYDSLEEFREAWQDIKDDVEATEGDDDEEED